jgi:hypothetical protein
LSGQCVSGVCCESSCNGLCMACRAGTGRCDVVPADDSDCPDVACNVDAECATAPVASIETSRCAAFGECKTNDDCNVTNFPPGRSCGGPAPILRVCDGQGQCIDPAVDCGLSSCAVSNQTTCCARRFADNSTSMTCEAVSACPITPFLPLPSRTQVTCDEPSDCRVGTVCCLTSASGGSSISCLPAERCNTRMPFVSYQAACRTPRSVEPCSGGLPCTAMNPLFPDWAFCNVPQR